MWKKQFLLITVLVLDSSIHVFYSHPSYFHKKCIMLWLSEFLRLVALRKKNCWVWSEVQLTSNFHSLVSIYTFSPCLLIMFLSVFENRRYSGDQFFMLLNKNKKIKKVSVQSSLWTSRFGRFKVYADHEAPAVFPLMFWGDLYSFRCTRFCIISFTCISEY